MALELIVLISGQAGEASRELQALKKHGLTAARNAAVLICGQDGQAYIFETGDIEQPHGPLLGAILGLFVKLVGESDLGVVAAQGLSLGLPEEHLTALQAGLQPGSSALVILAETEKVEETLGLLNKSQARVWKQALADDLLAQLSTGLASTS